MTCGPLADRRATVVTLTGCGWQAIEEAVPRHIDLVRRLFFGSRPISWGR